MTDALRDDLRKQVEREVRRCDSGERACAAPTEWAHDLEVEYIRQSMPKSAPAARALAERLRECNRRWLQCRERRPIDVRALCDTGDWLGSAAMDAAAELERLAAEIAALNAGAADLVLALAVCNKERKAARPALPDEETMALARFGLACLDESRTEFGDLEGGWVQDKATALGVLTPVEVTEPCDPEHCACAEFGFPMTCYRDSEATKACRALLARLAGGADEETLDVSAGFYVCTKCWKASPVPLVCFCRCIANDGRTIVTVTRATLARLAGGTEAKRG